MIGVSFRNVFLCRRIVVVGGFSCRRIVCWRIVCWRIVGRRIVGRRIVGRRIVRIRLETNANCEKMLLFFHSRARSEKKLIRSEYESSY